jgi:cytochrome c oxidase cbb3-type subunit 3
MPPWGDELTHTQLESVTRFVMHMRDDLEGAIAMLRDEAANTDPSLRVGRAVYAGRCALCHGQNGEGDGKMARIIKEPPPFNLTLSGLPDVYLRRIITQGGAELGRSPRMPPWGGDLTDPEIESVMLYVKSLRKY